MFNKNKNTTIEAINNNKFVKKTKLGIISLIFGRAGLYILLIGLQIMGITYLFTSIKVDSSLIYGGSILASTLCLIFILNMRINPYEKLSWSILLAIFPVAGLVIFIFANLDIGLKLEQRRIIKIEEETKDYHYLDKDLMKKIKKEDKQLYNIASYMLNKGSYPIYENTKAKYFSVGEDAFSDILESIKKAEKFIFIEFFILDRGYMWGTILEELVKKVNQGLEIRLMYDGTNAITRLPSGFVKDMEALGIKCKVFSPIYPIASTYYNNRDHRKILVIDGKFVYTGGINIADEYINVYERFGHWKDTAVRLEGRAVEPFTLMFLHLWHANDSERNFDKYLQQYTLKESDGYVIGFGDNPMRKEKLTKHLYMNILDTAKNYVYIMTPYLVLDNEILTSLKFAAERGIDVRIVLPAIPDKKIPYLLAKTHYQSLIESGVKIYEYLPGFMHGKTWLSDDEKAVVGSINLDYRALYLSFECAAFLYKNSISKNVYQDFEVIFNVSKLIRQEDVENYPVVKKIAGAFLKPFAPLI